MTNLLANDQSMDINEEYLQKQWTEAIGRMAAQIDDFKARVDSESELLCVKLSTEMASLQSDLKSLEADAATDDADAYAKRVTKLVEHLRAQGEAAYDLLQSTLPTDLDPAGVKIRRLEVLATGASGAARAAIATRIDELRTARAATHSDREADPRNERSSQQPPSSGG